MAQAQEFGRIQETETNTAYFYYAQPAEATVQVAVWGVPQPGLYEIPDSTDLDRLLSLAGGIPMQQRQENRKPPPHHRAPLPPRTIAAGPAPGGARGEPPGVEARVENLLEGRVDPPRLRENDIVVVETVQPTSFTWRDGLSIGSTLLSLTLLVLRIMQVGD
jgi:hypothetical protein